MHPLAIVAAAVAGAIHVWFFLMESAWFMRPRVHGRFGLRSIEEASTVRPWAFNQGFYNLFLAVGVALGLALATTGSVVAGRAIVLFACGSMVAAGVVLVATNRRFAAAAAIQAVPPAVAIIAGLFVGGSGG